MGTEVRFREAPDTVGGLLITDVPRFHDDLAPLVQALTTPVRCLAIANVPGI
jgi:hypothetical protein